MSETATSNTLRLGPTERRVLEGAKASGFVRMGRCSSAEKQAVTQLIQKSLLADADGIPRMTEAGYAHAVKNTKTSAPAP